MSDTVIGVIIGGSIGLLGSAVIESFRTWRRKRENTIAYLRELNKEKLHAYKKVIRYTQALKHDIFKSGLEKDPQYFVDKFNLFLVHVLPELVPTSKIFRAIFEDTLDKIIDLVRKPLTPDTSRQISKYLYDEIEGYNMIIQKEIYEFSPKLTIFGSKIKVSKIKKGTS